jgi:hypothetical protein
MTKQELLGDLNSRISAAKVTGFWTDEMKNLWINQAGQKVCDWSGAPGQPFHWPFLELALETVTRDSKEYYDYPEAPNEFKKNSIYQIDIEGEEYPIGQSGRVRVSWQHFQQAKQRGEADKIFTNHNGFYFLYKVPENGKTMSLYGLKKWRPLVNDEDEPITPDEFDEAIVKLALATCLRKAKKYDEARAESAEVMDPALGTLATMRASYEVEGPQGHGGTVQTSRW